MFTGTLRVTGIIVAMPSRPSLPGAPVQEDNAAAVRAAAIIKENNLRIFFCFYRLEPDDEPLLEELVEAVGREEPVAVAEREELVEAAGRDVPEAAAERVVVAVPDVLTLLDTVLAPDVERGALVVAVGRDALVAALERDVLVAAVEREVLVVAVGRDALVAALERDVLVAAAERDVPVETAEREVPAAAAEREELVVVTEFALWRLRISDALAALRPLEDCGTRDALREENERSGYLTA